MMGSQKVVSCSLLITQLINSKAPLQ